MTSSEDQTATDLLALLGSARDDLNSRSAQWRDMQSVLLHDSPTQQLIREVQERSGMVLGAASSAYATLHVGSAIQQAMEEMQERNAKLWLDVSSATSSIEGLGDLSGATGAMRRLGMLLDQSSLDLASASARLAGSFALPDALEAFRVSEESLTYRLLHLPSFAALHEQPEYLDAFARAAAVSDALAQSSGVHSAVWGAVQSFTLADMPTFDTLADYRGFLDASGLILARWPRLRLLTAAEKRRRIKARLKANAEPPHVRRAKTLVHSYERVLREIIDAAMAEAYGEDWPDERLPLCGCSRLLGKWRRRGGDVLEHADYADYQSIMADSEHFAVVFEVAFEDRDATAALVKKAGDLRATSHHARDFTPNDLHDLRLTWRTLEAGLARLVEDYEIEPLT